MGIIYIFFKILTKTTSIDKAQYELVFLHLFLVLDLSLRLFIRSIQKLFLLRGIGGRATIIIGWETDAIHVASEISRKPALGYKLKGYIADKESRKTSHYTPYLGKITELRIQVKKRKIREVIVAFGHPRHGIVLDIFVSLNPLPVMIKITPDMYESITGQARVTVLTGIPLIDINPDIITEFQRFNKRLIDIFIASLGLLFLIPLNILIGFFIKATTKGEIIYSQIRVGRDGREFILHKFRTMSENSEKESGPIWAVKNDPRITATGTILRGVTV